MIDNSVRTRTIVRTSIIGIIANAALAALKVAIGMLSNSVAIILDGVNNISDATASVITIIGTKLAGKAPDKKHPFGYGRIEYLSALIIAGIVLYAGITSLIESVQKIIEPERANYSIMSIVVITIAVVVKIVLGLYVRSVGNKVNSDSLINSGTDALLDSIISAATVVAAIVYLLLDISVEAYLGVIISAVIIKSGFDMIKETISQILGENNDLDLDRQIKETVLRFEGVRGVYDLILNNYGPDSHNGSLHIEVPDTYTADDIDKLLRQIQSKVYIDHNVILTAIGIYSYNTTNQEAIDIRNKLTKIVSANSYVRGLHGFYYDSDAKSIRCDVVISFDAKDRREECNKIKEELSKAFCDYDIIIAMDTDFTEGQ